MRIISPRPTPETDAAAAEAYAARKAALDARNKYVDETYSYSIYCTREEIIAKNEAKAADETLHGLKRAADEAWSAWISLPDFIFHVNNGRGGKTHRVWAKSAEFVGSGHPDCGSARWYSGRYRIVDARVSCEKCRPYLAGREG